MATPVAARIQARSRKAVSGSADPEHLAAPRSGGHAGAAPRSILPANPAAIPIHTHSGARVAPALRPLPLQRKLVVGATNDPLETEADDMAEDAIRRISAGIAPPGPPPAAPRQSGRNRDAPAHEAAATGAGANVLRFGAAPSIHPFDAPPSVHQVLQTPGQSLDAATRQSMETGFGMDLGRVRVHADETAQQSARAVNALAYTVGEHIVFGAGQLMPGNADGRRLIAHELAHVMQGYAGSPTAVRRQSHEENRVTIGYSFGKAFGYGWGGEPPPPFPDTNEMRKQLLRGVSSAFVDRQVIDECTIAIIGAPDTPGTRFRFVHPDLGHILDAIFDGREKFPNGYYYMDFHVEVHWTPPSAAGARPGAGGGSRSQPAKTGTDPQGRPVKPPAELLSTDAKHPSKDPGDTMRIYDLLRDKIKGQLGDKGDDPVKFARFLERNKGKIEGILRPSKTGDGLNEEEMQKIIDMYGKYIAIEDDEVPEAPKTVKDFDKVFKYDPNWQKMSKQDRQLLLDYASMNPEEIASGKLEFSRLTQDMKEGLALKLVDSWAGEVLEAAKAAFTDPRFVISLILTIGIYIGLWLVPDPSAVTKVAAGALTAFMWAMFAWEDIWNTMTEYSAFEENVRQARTAAELKAAGNRMAKKIGAVGFDILLMIAMWGLGKAAGPKLKAMRSKAAGRGVARADAGVKAAMSDPAAGLPKTAEGPAKTILADAEGAAKGTTATAVLDALEGKLSEPAQKGLQSLRNKAGDMGAYRSVKERTVNGQDLDHYLSERAATPEAKTAAKAKLLDAEAKLARAKLIEAETVADPRLRKAQREVVINETVQRFKARIKEMGLLKDIKVQQAWKANNLKDLTGALGEALSREQLKAGVAGAAGKRIVSNLVIVEDGPAYRTIAEWVAREKPTDAERFKVLQGKGRLYRALGEIDSMVVEDTPSGKPRASVIEEVKTGGEDSPTSARKQVTDKVLPGLRRVVAGDKTAHVFDLQGKYDLGAEQTANYDFSGDIKAQTRGPQGKGFDLSLGYDAEVLQATAKSLIEEGMPPATGPAMPNPVTSPDPRKDQDPEPGQGR